MKVVTKAEFERLYFNLGGGAATGWDLLYWNRFFVDNERSDMRYSAEEPQTPEHTRMMIVTDYAAKEYRLFFMTEEAEERFFEFPEES
jgi:hypothetical protein